VPDPVKTARSNVLLELEGKQSKEFRSFYLGKEVEVLFEESKEINGSMYQIGHTKDYVKVAVSSDEDLVNELRNVKIERFLLDDVLN